MRNNKGLHDSIVNNEYYTIKPDEDGFNMMFDKYYCSKLVNKRLKNKFLFKTRDLEPDLNIDNSDRSYEHSLTVGNPVCMYDIYQKDGLVEFYKLDRTKVFSLKNWFIRLYRKVKGLFIYE